MLLNKNSAYWSASYEIQNENNGIFCGIRFHLMSTTRKPITRNTSCISTRYNDWNMAQHVGDDALRVALHRQQLKILLNHTFDVQNSIFWLPQTHSATIVAYEEYEKYEEHEKYAKMKQQGIDGLMTFQEKSPCCVMTADCVPIFLWNESFENPIVCLLHAGWQGILNGIIEQSILKIKNDIHSKSNSNLNLNLNLNLKSFIGIHLSQHFFEVSYDVWQRFDDYMCQQQQKYEKYQKHKKPQIISKLKYYYKNNNENNQEKYYIDLSKVCTFLLQLFDIEVIGTHDDCTYQNDNLCYSHRRQSHQTPDNAMTGRMAHLIWFERF